MNWYAPNEIHGAGTVEQLRDFLLPNLDDLRNGTWPVDERQSGRPGGHCNRAPFVTAADVAAEIDFRMSGIVDSIALTLRYTAFPNWTYHAIARSLHYDEEGLMMEMELMLEFISGRKRKRNTYPEWKAKRAWRKRNKTTSYIPSVKSVSRDGEQWQKNIKI
ncbi:MAG: hypothetical protein WC454_09205 [Phycisphaerae bacterium]|jgi:hypothetical protein